jgi:hypothetical protein
MIVFDKCKSKIDKKFRIKKLLDRQSAAVKLPARRQTAKPKNKNKTILKTRCLVRFFDLRVDPRSPVRLIDTRPAFEKRRKPSTVTCRRRAAASGKLHSTCLIAENCAR